ncbi:MAG: hypothetical protein LBO00_06330 [Zoogloeaceae bacterium]|jgi:predicted nucleic-acid-binding Zn-ribbon protein|nr:hypothetical protein [Zoogloeaceae bacterium]
MSASKCPKCDHTQFEVIKVAVSGADRPVNFVQCAKCGSVVGVWYDYEMILMMNRILGTLNNKSRYS